VKTFKQGFRLRVGDLLKLGRIKFFIRELAFEGRKEKADSNELFLKGEFNCCISTQVQIEGRLRTCTETTCRICLSEE